MKLERPRFGEDVGNPKDPNEPDATILHVDFPDREQATFIPGTMGYSAYVTYRNLVDGKHPLAAFFRWLEADEPWSIYAILTLVMQLESLLGEKFEGEFVRMGITELEMGEGNRAERLRRVGRAEEALFRRRPQLFTVDLRAIHEDWQASYVPECDLEEEMFQVVWSAFLVVHRMCRRSGMPPEKRGPLRKLRDSFRPAWQKDL
jgi:hypothetical protein